MQKGHLELLSWLCRYCCLSLQVMCRYLVPSGSIFVISVNVKLVLPYSNVDFEHL